MHSISDIQITHLKLNEMLIASLRRSICNFNVAPPAFDGWSTHLPQPRAAACTFLYRASPGLSGAPQPPARTEASTREARRVDQSSMTSSAYCANDPSDEVSPRPICANPSRTAASASAFRQSQSSSTETASAGVAAKPTQFRRVKGCERLHLLKQALVRHGSTFERSAA